MTDKKPLAQFFRTKVIPPPLKKGGDFVPQFKFTIAQIPGRKNTTADFLSRLESHPKEQLTLEIRQDVLTQPIEINIE